MQREDLGNLTAFLAVAEERNFTRAAARLGVSQSALSHTLRRMETRLGVRLLTRTTRSVAPTEAGQRLLDTIGPAMGVIASQLASISELRDKPAGTIRITAPSHAMHTILWPALEKVLPGHPDVHVEVSLDSGFRDIVADRFDAGVRLGEALAKDMVATRIGPDLRMAIIGSPAYLVGRSIPNEPHDLSEHTCINLRLLSAGSLYVWELEKDGREVRVRVDGQLAFDSTEMVIKAAVSGFGLGFVMEDQVSDHIAAGRLVRVMEDWCPPFAGYHLYYPSRRQPSAAFTLILDALRRRS